MRAWGAGRGDDGQLSGSVALPCARSPGFHPRHQRKKEYRIIKHLGLFPSNSFFFFFLSCHSFGKVDSHTKRDYFSVVSFPLPTESDNVSKFFMRVSDCHFAAGNDNKNPLLMQYI